MVLYTVKFVTYQISGEKYIYLLLQLKLSQKRSLQKGLISPSFKFMLFLKILDSNLKNVNGTFRRIQSYLANNFSPFLTN